MPPAVTNWAWALQHVNCNASRLVQHAAGYALPDPSFLLAANDQQMTCYLTGWLKNWHAFIYQLNMLGEVLLGTKEWWEMLHVSNGGKRSSGTKEGTSANCLKATMQNFLLGLQADHEDSIRSLTLSPLSITFSQTMRWKSQELPCGQQPERQHGLEIIWEINKINFHYELVAMALQCCPNGIGGHQLALQCFSQSLLIDVEANPEEGLISRQWQIRHPYLLWLRDLVLTFEKNDSCSFVNLLVDADVNKCTEEQVLSFERALAQYYMQLFFFYFGKPAIIPRHL